MTGIKYMVSGDVAMLVIPKNGHNYKCYVDSDFFLKLRTQCTSIDLVYARRGCPPYATVYMAGRNDYMHRFVLGISRGDSREVDHKNGNSLDCRRKNLRAVSNGINQLNRHSATAASKSGIRGVTACGDKWMVQIRSSEKRIYGLYNDPRAAAEHVWLALLAIDPVSAQNYLRSLPRDFNAWLASTQEAA